MNLTRNMLKFYLKNAFWTICKVDVDILWEDSNTINVWLGKYDPQTRFNKLMTIYEDKTCVDNLYSYKIVTEPGKDNVDIDWTSLFMYIKDNIHFIK